MHIVRTTGILMEEHSSECAMHQMTALKQGPTSCKAQPWMHSQEHDDTHAGKHNDVTPLSQHWCRPIAAAERLEQPLLLPQRQLWHHLQPQMLTHPDESARSAQKP